jgi:hypothetical protein
LASTALLVATQIALAVLCVVRLHRGRHLRIQYI